MTIEVSEREFHTLIAALRCYQETIATDGLTVELDDVASNGDAIEPLACTEIDPLIERLAGWPRDAKPVRDLD